MSKRLKKRVNGGLAIYFGIGSAFAALMSLIVMLVQAYKIIFLEADTSWEAFLLLIILLIVSGGMAYVLLRVGYEEIEN